MKIKIYLLPFLFLAFLSCSKEDDLSKQGFTSSDFENNLNSEMTYNSIIAKFGEPSSDIGSGIHIYVYQLTDSTEVWIGYTDKIIYARHMNRNHQIIKNII